MHDIIFDTSTTLPHQPRQKLYKAQQRIFEEEYYNLCRDVALEKNKSSQQYPQDPSSSFYKLGPIYGDSFHAWYTPVHIPAVDYQHIPENHRPFVYPSCGHVHAYHKSLASARTKQCPICRTIGPFVPLIFSYDAVLSPQIPTHVFNPCGHVASLELCRQWSAIPLPSNVSSLVPSCSSPMIYASLHSSVAPLSHSTGISGVQHEEYGLCPFCAEPLHTSRPFSRLIMQYDETVPHPTVTTSKDSIGNNSLGASAATSTSSSAIANVSGMKNKHNSGEEISPTTTFTASVRDQSQQIQQPEDLLHYRNDIHDIFVGTASSITANSGTRNSPSTDASDSAMMLSSDACDEDEDDILNGEFDILRSQRWLFRYSKTRQHSSPSFSSCMSTKSLAVAEKANTLSSHSSVVSSEVSSNNLSLLSYSTPITTSLMTYPIYAPHIINTSGSCFPSSKGSSASSLSVSTCSVHK